MTKMRDNFSNPNPFLSQAKNYQDLVNQPHWAEPLADSFKQSASQPAKGPQQRMANAMMGGFASGIQGAVNKERQDRLSPILEQAGQITARAAELEAHSQQEQARQFAIQEYGRKYTPLVATFADLVDKGDPRSSMVLEDLISKAGSIPGYENLKAERWDATTGTGWALNTKTGEYRKITADEIISVIAPSAQAIYGERWFEKFLPLNAGVAKDAQYAFNTNREETELGLTKKRADIANTYSQAKVHNKQAEKISHEINAPQVNQYQEKRNIAAALKNQDEVYKVITPKLENQEKTLDMYDRLETALDSATILRGDSSTAAVLRFFAREFGLDENIATAKMTGLQMESKLKEMLGAAFGQEEGNRILGKMVGPDKNYAAAKKQIAQEKRDLIKDIVKNRIRINTYAQQEHANLEHPELYKNLESDIKQYSSERMPKKNKNTNNNDLSDLQ